jgi:hypothetical protein
MVVFISIIIAGLMFAPTGVPVRVFSDANLTKVPPHLLSAARFVRLEDYAVNLAVSDYAQSRGAGSPHLQTMLTALRGRLMSGKDQMAIFALERGYVGQGIYGWQEAASHCFTKPAEGLTLSDAATLLLHMRSPSSAWGNRSGDLLDRRNALLMGMAESGYITNEVAAETVALPLVHCGN